MAARKLSALKEWNVWISQLLVLVLYVEHVLMATLEMPTSAMVHIIIVNINV